MQASFEDLTRKVSDARGQGGKWPASFDYRIESNRITLEVNRKIDKSGYRCLDSWGIALLHEVRTKHGADPRELVFVINGNHNPPSLDFEAFLRRVSYLNINNESIQFGIVSDHKKVDLYNQRSLFNRPDDEIIRKSLNVRHDDDKGSFLEKSFQAFLFGKGQETETRTNDRMAILGEHFFQLKKKHFGILREFPTGAYRGRHSKGNQITPTELVDIVTLNRWGYLSVVEIKLDDSRLEVISQLLDYALYFASYHVKVLELIRSSSDLKPLKNDRVDCYVVNNRFHPRFDDVFGYYRTNHDSYGFRVFKVVLGYTTTGPSTSFI